MGDVSDCPLSAVVHFAISVEKVMKRYPGTRGAKGADVPLFIRKHMLDWREDDERLTIGYIDLLRWEEG